MSDTVASMVKPAMGSRDNADLDLAEIAHGKYDFDVAGHYARPGIFQLQVNEQSARNVLFDSEAAGVQPLIPRRGKRDAAQINQGEGSRGRVSFALAAR